MQSWRYIAVALLAVLTAFFLWLIGGTKRFHDRTVAELNEKENALMRNAVRQIDRVWRLAIVHGLAQQASHTVDFFSGSLPIDDLKYLEGNIRQTIDNYFGGDREAKEAFYKARPTRPDEGESQVAWVNSYCWGLANLIDQERAPQKLIPDQLSKNDLEIERA